MNWFFCWLLGHEYVGAMEWKWDHGTHESVARLHRNCLCCDGYDGEVRVNDSLGSRFLWKKAWGLVRDSEKRRHSLLYRLEHGGRLK